MVKRNSIFYAWFVKPYSLILIISLLFLLTFGVSLYVWYQHFHGDIRNTLSSDKTTAHLLSSLIVEYQKASIGVLQSYASRPLFVNALKERDSKKILFHLTQLKETNNEIDGAFVSDKNGVLLFNYPVDRVSHGKNLSYRDWYKGMSKGWKPYVSGVFRLIIGEKELAVAVCVPVFDQNRRVIGILGSSQSVSFLSNIIRQVPLDKYTKLTLVDHSGYIVYNNKFPYTKEVSSYPSFPLIKKAIQEHKDMIEMEDLEEGNIKSYVTLAPLKDIGWTVVVERTDKDILRAGYRDLTITVIVSFLFFIIISLSLFYTRKSFLLSETTKLLDMERTLKQQEERFTELFEHMSSAVAVYEARNDGKDFIFKDFNTAAEKIGNISREQVIGKSVLEMFPGVKDLGLFDVFQRVYKTGEPERFPITFYKDQRISGWRENYVYKLSSGEIVAIYNDITEQKQAEEHIYTSHQQLLDIIEFLPDATFVVDKEKKVIAWNRAIEEMTGAMKENMLGKGDYEYAIPFYGIRRPILIDLIFMPDLNIKKNYKFVEQKGHAFYGEAFVSKVYGGRGAHLWGVASSLFDSSGDIIGAIESVRNITDKKNIEKTLFESEIKYRSIFDNAIEGISQVTPEGRFISVNRALARMAGYDSPEEMIKSITNIGNQLYVNPEDRVRYKKMLEEQGVIKEFETQHYRKDGSIFWASINARAVKNEAGKVLYYEGTVEDITERKRAEEELRESEENFRCSLDDSPLGIRIVTIEGETIYANPAMLNIYGYDSIEELRTTPLKERYTPESYAEFQIRKEKRRKGEYDPFEYEVSIVRKNGEVRHLQVFRKEILWNGERQFQTIYQDITERRLIEDALKFTRFSLDNAADTMVCVDHEAHYVDVNDAFCRSVGYSRKELLSMTVHDIDPDYSSEIWPEFWKKLKQSGSLTFESRHRTKDGKTFPVEIVANFFIYKGKEYHSGLARNITERKIMEETLRKSEEKYRSIFDNAVEGIFQTTADGKYISVNPALARMVGYDSPEELIKKIDDISKRVYVNPEDRVRYKKIIEEKGWIEGFEMQHYRKDGSIFWASIKARAVKDEAGKVLYYEGTVEDITSRKLTEEELKKSYEQLHTLTDYLQRVREDEQTRIAREIHDELGQSLTGLKIDTSWVKKGLAHIKDISPQIMEKIDSIMQMIDNTIQETRKLSSSLRPSILDDLGLITALRWYINGFKDRTGIKCKIISRTEDIKLDQEKLTALFRICEECFTNVSRHANATVVTVNLIDNPDSIIMEVSDNGIGISQSKINNPQSFGLMGMKERANLMGGELHIISQPGKGTIVRTKIPVKSEAENTVKR